MKKKGKNRSFAQQSIYDGIKFQSLLEIYCYKELKKYGFKFEYEKHTYTLIEGFASNNPVSSSIRKIFKARTIRIRPITYTPDFVGDGWVIETKGFKTEGFKFRWKLFLRYIRLNDLKLEVFLPTNQKEVDQVITYLKNEYPPFKS